MRKSVQSSSPSSRVHSSTVTESRRPILDAEFVQYDVAHGVCYGDAPGPAGSDPGAPWTSIAQVAPISDWSLTVAGKTPR
jgi:hypothetical protein